MNPLTRHRKLLENKKVERWYSNVKARSQVTSDTYLRNFGLWLEYLHLDPESVISMAKDNFEEFKGIVSDQIRGLEAKGTMGSSISTSVKALISYLKFYNVNVRLGINIKNENRNLNAEKERIPAKEELAKILRVATLRERVLISLMAFSGLRPEVLGNIDGTDGLTLGDITDISIDHGKIEIKIVPLQIAVRPELSKIRTRYYTFMGPEGSEYLKEYLETRTESGEKLTVDSPVILPVEKQSLEKKNRFLMTTLLLRRIKATIVKSGFDWRPYIFRVYFGTNLDMAESKGKISHPWRQFVMGHKGDIEETYTKREGITDEGREQYAQCLKFLETEEKGITEKQHNEEINVVKIMMLKLAGYTEDEINNQDMLDMDISDLVKKFDEKRSKSMNNGNSQKVISVKEVKDYISQGWEYVNTLPGNKDVIVKLPS
ncbi:MAG: site-specific integrase [Thermoplasmataceae archaeon]|jgi:integrase